MVIVLMGVSGSGKTTIGMRLAERIHAQFIDADDYHSAANKAKMAAGQPLDDDDRIPWLEQLNRILRDSFNTGKSVVMACSALKQKYRDMLKAGMPAGTLHLIFLDPPAEILAKRVNNRRHAFMNRSLLNSQLTTLEPIQTALRLANDRAPEQVVDYIVAHLSDAG